MTRRNDRLVRARSKMGLSQKEAAKCIGIASSMYAMLETGDRKGSDLTKLKVAKFFELPVGYLFFGDNITNGENNKKELTK